jgi:hypothetical protein
VAACLALEKQMLPGVDPVLASANHYYMGLFLLPVLRTSALLFLSFPSIIFAMFLYLPTIYGLHLYLHLHLHLHFIFILIYLC